MYSLKNEILHAYVDVGFGPGDCCDDEDGPQAGTDDDHGVDCNEGVGQPLGDRQHWQLRGGDRGIVHDLETEKGYEDQAKTVRYEKF